MTLNIKAVEIKLTPAIKLYVEKKFDILKKVLVRQERLDAVLAKVEIGKISKHHHSGDMFKAEAHMKVGRNAFNASAIKEDLYAAIDEVKDELEREIISNKDRAQTLRTRGARKIKKILKGLKKPN